MPALARSLFAIASVAPLIAAGGTAHAQAARQGDENVTHIFTFTDKVLKMGERTIIQRELSGVSRNDRGSGMFHDMGLRCLSFIDIVGGSASATGRCTAVDSDGDQIFHTFENKAGVGAHILVGGTGKYAGITGREDIVNLTRVKAPEGTNAMVVPLKATWKLP